MLNKLRSYFSTAELLLWGASESVIILSFFLFGGGSPLSLAASIIGASSLILAAKGNPLAQVLMIAFCAMYGVISYSCQYYGEMITYLGMTGPMAVLSLISWLRNPFGNGRAEVRVNRISLTETAFMLLLSAAVTAVFFFILRALGTASILMSTLSVTTSFIAVYLTFRRSPFFAAAYAANDLVLIVLWSIASLHDRKYLSVLICFIAFFVNDIYGFISWNKMQKRQEAQLSGAFS